MLKIEKFVTASPEQWEIIIEGARNPMNSWDRMDSYFGESPMDTFEAGCYNKSCDDCAHQGAETCLPEYTTFGVPIIGPNDHQLLENLAKGGPVHGKYKRQIPVWVMINAPLYWWKEMDQYKVGTTTNSCSTMHKIHAKEFTLEDFSCEKLYDDDTGPQIICDYCEMYSSIDPMDFLRLNIDMLNHYRGLYLLSKNKKDWDQMIQMLPSSYNQKRLWTGNYEVLTGIYRDRRNHKLDEWHVFCDWIRELPYSELITGEEE